MTDRGGWAASLSSYMKNDELFECPSAPIDETISGSGRTDYGYNAELAGISPPVFNNSANNVLFFETDQNLATVQTASRSNTSRVRTARHLGGSNYVFIDGHLKWLESWRPPVTAPANGCNFTFAT